ncbi:class I SAM-dependent methyltransferase [Halioxenophilus sp. WMMB6]|uniref:class I SAM-dependent methyltransferase n=1 Tax=Halioxenophilus sp. WMMB6 TaxID=3073815 RepID=UPI00295EEB0E|nr:class I SAM-dependent methyltransferase [Halioxenophilus sp. WMMB6]
MTIALPANIDSVKGFLDKEEGQALVEYARAACAKLPALEVGSYCGKSTLYLAAACQSVGSIVYAVDHHRGSEEHQPGEEYHDPVLFDSQAQKMDSFREFRANIDAAGLTDSVVPIVATSAVAAKMWQTPLGLVFIDGGHSEAAAQADYHGWARHVAPGGFLAIHDLFPNPEEGGQAPINIWRQAQASGLFESVEVRKTLGILRRI